jgi:Ni/Fe-hydrogenase subunit HybB-like protein
MHLSIMQMITILNIIFPTVVLDRMHRREVLRVLLHSGISNIRAASL